MVIKLFKQRAVKQFFHTLKLAIKMVTGKWTSSYTAFSTLSTQKKTAASATVSNLVVVCDLGGL